MEAFQDKDGKYFLLLPEVWQHIVESHPEIERHLEKIGKTLAHPVVIYQSVKFADRHLYYCPISPDLYFVVVVDMKKGIIKTSYISDRIKGGNMVWRAKK
jgi:hypothetical protein